jgi:NAD(P)-dependent dehydrogenase (short-subunit alcohol dehydrogenase family)
MTTYLVTGANRGIGLEIVKRLAGRGDAVVGTARDLGALSVEARGLAGVRWVALDTADEASTGALPAGLAAAGVTSVDVLVNNAGVSSAARTLGEVTGAELQRVFAVNAFGPILVARALRGLLEAGRRRLIVNVSSQLASIANNTGGSSYAYRSSKTALNQLTVCLANEWRAAGITCLAVHPGWVRTEMGGKEAPLSPAESAEHLVRLIDAAEPGMSGRFVNYDGKTMPW